MPPERSSARATSIGWLAERLLNVPLSFLGFGDLLRHKVGQLFVAKAG